MGDLGEEIIWDAYQQVFINDYPADLDSFDDANKTMYFKLKHKASNEIIKILTSKVSYIFSKLNLNEMDFEFKLKKKESMGK
jgi:hypothetical protein